VHLAEPNKNPAKEAAALRQIKNLHTTSPVLVVGNFNLENEDGAMQAWMNDGFEDAAMGKKTTLRITPDASGKRLDKGLDHFLLKSEQWEVHDSGTLDFSSQFLNLNTARMISGHIPVWASLSLR
jgi:endonuclease/exonuclease/phosphatase family metal-dependent hydrolase